MYDIVSLPANILLIVMNFLFMFPVYNRNNLLSSLFGFELLILLLQYLLLYTLLSIQCFNMAGTLYSIHMFSSFDLLLNTLNMHMNLVHFLSKTLSSVQVYIFNAI